MYRSVPLIIRWFLSLHLETELRELRPQLEALQVLYHRNLKFAWIWLACCIGTYVCFGGLWNRADTAYGAGLNSGLRLETLTRLDRQRVVV